MWIIISAAILWIAFLTGVWAWIGRSLGRSFGRTFGRDATPGSDSSRHSS